MRKVLMLAAVVAAIGSFLVVGVASAGPATISRSDGSIWFDGNGAPVFVASADVQVVFTNNPDGTTNVTGRGTLPAGSALPGHALHFDNANTGFICGFGGLIEFSGVTTPSGQFSFTCKSD